MGAASAFAAHKRWCLWCFCYFPRPRGKGTAASFGLEPAEARLAKSDQSHPSREEGCPLGRPEVADPFWSGTSSVGSAGRLEWGKGGWKLSDKLLPHNCSVGHRPKIGPLLSWPRSPQTHTFYKAVGFLPLPSAPLNWSQDEAVMESGCLSWKRSLCSCCLQPVLYRQGI